MTPILLTWNLPAKKAAKARMLAMRSGVRVAAVETWQYLQSLGSFTGDCGSMESLYDGAGFRLAPSAPNSMSSPETPPAPSPQAF